MKRALSIAIATALASTTAHAVMLNPRGTGQVLVYPYYTVNNQQTLISVINTTAHSKALKVRFRESYDGRDVSNFNVYLGAYDSWVGSVFSLSSDSTGGAAIASSDHSCTVPAFDSTFFPNGAAVLKFVATNYTTGAYGTATGVDSGPTGIDRTREGFFEIIEMGEVVDQASASKQTVEAIGQAFSFGANCAQVVTAWSAGGYWTVDPTVDLQPPAGGVYGAAGIVDVAQGTLYTYNAEAVDGFSDVIQHTAPGNSKPNLATAITDSAHQVTSAYVPVGNSMIRADYPAATQAVDAVSAIFMANSINNQFDIETGIAGASDWLVTFPTKQFYVDPGIVNTSLSSYIQPFAELFGGGLDAGKAQDPGVSCIATKVALYDRDGKLDNPPDCGFPECPPVVNPTACSQTSVMPFNGVLDVPTAVLKANPLGGSIKTTYQSGNASMSFAAADLSIPSLRAATNGIVFYGLPAIGFVAENFINDAVSQGVLSNYSGLYAHHYTVGCSPTAADPNAACK